MGTTLLAANENDVLRKFLANSLVGMALTDDPVRKGIATLWSGSGFTSWKTDDGHYHSSHDAWLLMVRGLSALVEEDTEASRAALRTS